MHPLSHPLLPLIAGLLEPLLFGHLDFYDLIRRRHPLTMPSRETWLAAIENVVKRFDSGRVSGMLLNALDKAGLYDIAFKVRASGLSCR